MTRSQRQRTDAFDGDYPANWPEIAERVKVETRATRLMFPGLPEWLDGVYTCIRCRHVHQPDAGFTLTVHHLDMNKPNCLPWNLAALCQRCHLRIQGKVDFLQPYMGEHSPWLAPFVDYFERAQGYDFTAPGWSAPDGDLWTTTTMALAILATRDRPPCICPGWVYQHPETAARASNCPAHPDVVTGVMELIDAVFECHREDIDG